MRYPIRLWKKSKEELVQYLLDGCGVNPEDVSIFETMDKGELIAHIVDCHGFEQLPLEDLCGTAT